MSTLLRILPLFGFALASGLAQAKTVSCVAESLAPFYLDGSRPKQKEKTVYRLKASSTEAGVLESVELSTEFSPFPAMEGVAPRVVNDSAKYLKADPDQKGLLGSWIRATAYLIQPEPGCWGSSVLVILPDNLHRLKKGIVFKTAITRENVPLNCSVLD